MDITRDGNIRDGWYLSRMGKIRRIRSVVVFPRQNVTGQSKIAERVASDAGNFVSTCANDPFKEKLIQSYAPGQPRPVAWTSRIRPPVPVAAPGKGQTPTKIEQNAQHETNQCNLKVPLTGWEIVRLSGVDQMSNAFVHVQLRWSRRILGNVVLHLKSLDRTRRSILCFCQIVSICFTNLQYPIICSVHIFQSTWTSFDSWLFIQYLLLSQKAMTLFGLEYFCVSWIRWKSDFGRSFPSTTIRPLKNQWRLCSLQLIIKWSLQYFNRLHTSLLDRKNGIEGLINR